MLIKIILFYEMKFDEANLKIIQSFSLPTLADTFDFVQINKKFEIPVLLILSEKNILLKLKK